MILVRTPFRISFAGGGSDLPSYYRTRPGAVVSATIDKYMYLALHPYFHDKIRLKYSQTEDVDRIADIQHPIIRECLSLRQIPTGMELASFADVPSGTGLGSSSAFTVGLLHALREYRGEPTSAEDLARGACEVEIDRLGQPIGKQDQYAAAYGGLNFIQFRPDEIVQVTPLSLDARGWKELESRLILLFLGKERQARDILREQAGNMADPASSSKVARMVRVAWQFRTALELNRFSDCGDLLHEGWMLKRELASAVTNDEVDSVYRRARAAGASGGKLLGAGGSGFFLLYCEPERRDAVRAALGEFREMPFRFSSHGSQVRYSDGADAFSAAPEQAFAIGEMV